MNLRAIFDSLPRPKHEGSFSVEKSERQYRVGRSFEGYPALLIAFGHPGSDSLPRRLANLHYSPPKQVELSADTGTHSAQLAILECRTAEAELIDYFFRIVSTTLLGDARTATADGFEAGLDAVASLFRALQQPPQRSVQGLWAELAIIAWSQEPEAALAGWHSEPRGLHDFSAGPERLEVKSSSTGLREHTVRLDQLADLTGGQTLVASLVLDETTGGANVYDLIGIIEERATGPELRRRLQVIVASSLGTAWKEAGELRFDLALARERTRIYRGRDVPSVPLPLPPEVKGVTFTVDLSTTPSLPIELARDFADFFRMVLPGK